MARVVSDERFCTAVHQGVAAQAMMLTLLHLSLLMLLPLLQVGIVHQHIRFIPNCNFLAGVIVR
jgi:hypothetical protein